MHIKRIATLMALPAFVFGSTLSASAAARPTSNFASGTPRLGADMHDMGRAKITQPMSVTLMLNYQHAGELEPLIAAQADPSSPTYRRFLTRQQFDAYFSPSVAAYARTIAALRSEGFTNITTSPNRLLVKATAPSGTVERVFSTEMHNVLQAGHGVRFSNALPAHVPAELTSTVAAVGLSNLVHVHTDNVVLPHGQNTIKPNLATPGQLLGPDGGYGPLAYDNAYDFPVKTSDGKGEGAGVVIDADYLNTDLAAYLKYFGIFRDGPPTKRVLVDGGPPSGLTADSDETTLDVETIVGMAPGVALYVYETPALDDDSILDAYNNVVTDDFVGPVNSSFGGCEIGDAFFTSGTDAVAAQGAALGITFHASSGDDGSSTFGCSGVAVSAPASSPHFMAIGGTSLYIDPTTGKFQQEVAWGSEFGASGGGVSVVFKMPSYQKGVATQFTSGRNVPDVSFDADPATGESFYIDGAFEGPIGGTSLSSPIFGASVAIDNAIKNKEAGYVNPRIYSKFKASGYLGDAFRDITSGSNGFYNAGKGYDNVTGIGSMNVTATTSTVK